MWDGNLSFQVARSWSNAVKPSRLEQYCSGARVDRYSRKVPLPTQCEAVLSSARRDKRHS